MALLLRMAGVPFVARDQRGLPGLAARRAAPASTTTSTRWSGAGPRVARPGSPLPAGDDGRLRVRTPLPGGARCPAAGPTWSCTRRLRAGPRAGRRARAAAIGRGAGRRPAGRSSSPAGPASATLTAGVAAGVTRRVDLGGRTDAGRAGRGARRRGVRRGGQHRARAPGGRGRHPGRLAVRAGGAGGAVAPVRGADACCSATRRAGCRDSRARAARCPATRA